MTTAVALLAVIATVIVVVVVDTLLRRRKSTPKREFNLDEAWEHYLSHPDRWAPRDQQAIDSLPQEKDETLDKLKHSLRETVEKARLAHDPLVVLRLAIMDATDRFVLVETLYEDSGNRGNDPRTETTAGDYTLSVVEAGVLRRFSMLAYGDFATEDWYSHYLKVAEMNANNVAAMVTKTIRGEGSPLETSLHDPLTRAMRRARESLLHHPPRTPVTRSTQLSAATVRTKRAPTQEQIDRLTDLMSWRFEKLFSGQVYQLEQGPFLNPAGAFQVDAALLHTQLSFGFSQATAAWRQIMDSALGQYKEAMQNEDELLEIAGEFHRIWVDRQYDGPLGAVLEKACEMAFDLPAGADRVAVAAGMMEDAGILIGAIQDIANDEG